MPKSKKMSARMKRLKAKLYRESLSEEMKEKTKERSRLRSAALRAIETPEEREMRLKRGRARQRKRRAEQRRKMINEVSINETPEEREVRLLQSRVENKRIRKRVNESPEKREERLRKAREQQRMRRQMPETPEQKEERLRKAREQQRKRRLALETPEQREKRLMREWAKQARDAETPEQRLSRLKSAKEQTRLRRLAQETPDQREKRMSREIKRQESFNVLNIMECVQKQAYENKIMGNLADRMRFLNPAMVYNNSIYAYWTLLSLHPSMRKNVLPNYFASNDEPEQLPILPKPLPFIKEEIDDDLIDSTLPLLNCEVVMKDEESESNYSSDLEFEEEMEEAEDLTPSVEITRSRLFPKDLSLNPKKSFIQPETSLTPIYPDS